jgi:hypothetical protein
MTMKTSSPLRSVPNAESHSIADQVQAELPKTRGSLQIEGHLRTGTL